MNRRTIVAAVAAVSLAFSPLAAPPAAADAGGRDYTRLVLGVLAAAAIAKSLQNERERERAREQAAREQAAREQAARERANVTRRDPPPFDPFTRGDDRRRDHHGHRGRQRDWQQRLPAYCEFDVRTRQGWTAVLGRRCLEREGIRTSRLPARCEFDVRTDQGRRTVFGSRCLRDHGYRVEARRH